MGDSLSDGEISSKGLELVSETESRDVTLSEAAASESEQSNVHCLSDRALPSAH
jgi:hypothetical protein